ncbi:MAG: TIGR04282 family arsenosugar biosynthesis glycosyltransferase [Solirubrobacteraceae bacterium]
MADAAGRGNGPAVLVIARAPRRGEVRRALEPVLGADGCLALHAALLVEAVRWGRSVAGDAVHVAHDPPDSGPELRALLETVPAHPVLFPQNGDGISGRLADAVGRVFGRGHGGPLLIVWPDLPRLRPEHATAALDDLRSGCDVALGPAYDGGFYLVAVRRPLPALFGLPEAVWRSSDAMTMGLTAARDAGLEVGILRAERALHRPADVRAALADPTLPESIARVLKRAKLD